MDITTSAILIAIFILIYFILIEFFSVLFRISGMTKDKARFQSISLLTNCGYTTSESELVASSKFRRRIALANMITGNAFSVIIVSLILNVLLNLSGSELQRSAIVLGIVVGSFFLLLIFMNLPFVRKGFDKIIEKLAYGIIASKNHKNTINLIETYGSVAIAEIAVRYVPEELKDKAIMHTGLKRKYGLNLMFIHRKRKNVEVRPDTIIQPGDILTLCGEVSSMRALFNFAQESIAVHEEQKNPNPITVLENFERNVLAKISIGQVPALLKDKTLKESGLKQTHDITVILIERNNQAINAGPGAMIKKGDKVMVFGDIDSIKAVFGNGLAEDSIAE